MKWNYVLLLVATVFLVNVLYTRAENNNKKESQQQKHKQDKPHKQPASLQHWDDERYGPKQKQEQHHNVKDVQKHAPLTVSHHEAKMQVNLGHTNKKQTDRASSSKSDMKLQDLASEDLVHHKTQSHKTHNGRDNHSPHSATSDFGAGHNQHKLGRSNANAGAALNSNSRHAKLAGNGMADRKDKKPPKKALLNKTKKTKRTKRLHKQYIF